MRRDERPFSKTVYARLRPETAAKRMLARDYCQVSRRFGHVSRVDVSDKVLLVRVGARDDRSAKSWYDYYRRCISTDVITDVPEPIMRRIRGPGMLYILRSPRCSDEEVIAMMIELGLVNSA